MKLRDAKYQGHNFDRNTPIVKEATVIKPPTAQKLSIGGVTFGVGAGIVAWVASKLGVTLTVEDGVEIVAVAGAVGAFLFHYGLKGAIQIVWHGVDS